MCFGWVDSMTRRIDEDSYMLRFTPQRPRSSWTPGNVVRAEELLAQGLMTEAGVRAFERRRSRKTALHPPGSRIHPRP